MADTAASGKDLSGGGVADDDLRKSIFAVFHKSKLLKLTQ